MEGNIFCKKMASPLCIDLVFLVLDEEETRHKEHEQRTSYTDAKSARVIMFAEVKRLLELNPIFTQKLQFPNLPNSWLRTLINHRRGKSKVLRSAKAKLHFPFGRLDRFIKHRVTKQTPIFIAAILECLDKEVLKGAGNSAKQRRRRVIWPKHIKQAVNPMKGCQSFWQALRFRLYTAHLAEKKGGDSAAQGF